MRMWRTKLSDEEVAELTQRLAELSGKASLVDGLNAAAQNVSSRRVRKALFSLADQASKGTGVAQGLTNSGMPAYLIGLIYAGSKTGRLPSVLSALARHYRERRRWSRRIWLTLAYPFFVFLLLGILICIVFGAIVPQFREIFDGFDLDLSALTETMIWVSEVGPTYAGVFLLFCSIVLIVIYLIGGSIALRRLMASCPGIGKLFQWHGIMEFFKLLELMLIVETPLHEALRLTANAVRDSNVSDFAGFVASHVEKGRKLSSVLKSEIDVPGGIHPVLQWGEETGRLADAMVTASEILDGRLQLRTRFVTSMLPPIMFICVGGFAIVLVFCLFMPLASLISNLAM